jgi:hypothetical protein
MHCVFLCVVHTHVHEYLHTCIHYAYMQMFFLTFVYTCAHSHILTQTKAHDPFSKRWLKLTHCKKMFGEENHKKTVGYIDGFSDVKL